MSAHNFTTDYSNPITPRFDDEDDDREEPMPGKTPGPVGALVQRKFLEQRKIFLWGAVTDESAKDLTEKLLYLEAVGPGEELAQEPRGHLYGREIAANAWYVLASAPGMRLSTRMPLPWPTTRKCAAATA